MAQQLLKQIFFSLLALCDRAFKLVRDYIFIWWKPGLAKPREQQGKCAQKSSRQRAAIVAVQADPHTVLFLANLLNGLADNNFFIVVVAAGNIPPALKNTILSQCHYLLERFSFGQESSIKAAWDWIQQRDDLKDIDTLALVNDGFYYPRYITSTIGQMLGQTDDWLSLFEISRIARSKNSFQIFRSPVFASDAFRNFWRDYSLSPVRLRAIASGEGDLAGVLRKAGFAPQAYYNLDRLYADVVAALGNENVPSGLQDVLNLTIGFERTKSSRGLPRRNDALSLPVDEVAHRISMMTEKSDPARTVGLLCNYLYQAPIKRDLCAHNGPDAKDLVELAQGFSAEEKEAMASDLRNKVAANFADMRKIPQRFMRIARSV